MYSSERIPVAPRSSSSSSSCASGPQPLAPQRPTCPTLSLQELKHKAAIATNNNGVTLLNRGYYRQALETFQDSMKLMKSARGHLESTLPTASFKDDLSVGDVETLVRRSWKRCAECCSGHNPATVTTMVDSHGGQLPQQIPLPILQTISSQYGHEGPSMAFTFCTFLSSLYVAFPMTIDPIDFPDNQDPQSATQQHRRSMEYQLESAVLLYNYGIAYDCLAIMAARSGQRALETLLREKTSRIYPMADALVQIVARNISPKPSTYTADTTTGTLQCVYHNNRATLLPRCLVIHGFVTYNLIQTCIQRNLPRLYRAHCRALDELLDLLAAHEQCLPTRDHHLAAAA
jgi:hypothetical protein